VIKKDKDGIRRAFQILTLNQDQITQRTAEENTGAEKNKMFPTDLGMVVTDFLKQHFAAVMDYHFTAKIENEFDEIANGKMVWNQMLSEFYKPFHQLVETTMETADRASGERELGIDPVSGKRVIARIGRFGPMIQIGNVEDEEKPRFATLRTTQSIETITYEEAMELFKLPLSLGEFEGLEVSVNIGRFGPYVKHGEQFISLPKGEEPLGVSLDRAIEVIQAKQVEDAAIAHFDGKPVTKGKGRFGPFIKWNDMFINIPRAYNFDTITEAECTELILKKIDKEANRFIQQFPEEKISIENGRWGPFVRFQKKMLKLMPKPEGGKYTAEEAALLTLDEIKKMVEAQVPNAFTKKATAKKAAVKKAAVKKVPVKRAASAKAVPKKAAVKK
jgi:DNA topoisomerase-1